MLNTIAMSYREITQCICKQSSGSKFSAGMKRKKKKNWAVLPLQSGALCFMFLTAQIWKAKQRQPCCLTDKFLLQQCCWNSQLSRCTAAASPLAWALRCNRNLWLTAQHTKTHTWSCFCKPYVNIPCLYMRKAIGVSHLYGWHYQSSLRLTVTKHALLRTGNGPLYKSRTMKSNINTLDFIPHAFIWHFAGKASGAPKDQSHHRL